jgi:hypothetical protein
MEKQRITQLYLRAWFEKYRAKSEEIGKKQDT